MAKGANKGRPHQLGKSGGLPSSRPGGLASRDARPPSESSRIANLRRSYERHLSLAQAAEAGGDAVEIENHNQHAEHYLRQMRESTAAG